MRVLLLEDHPALRDMIRAYLVQRGFAVDAVERGDEALAAVGAVPYDAIIIDLGLPDIDGTDVLAAVRVRTRGRLPTLIVTARDAIDDRVRGLNAGADDYLVKPFELVELEARLRAVLRRPGGRAEVAHAYGKLSFDATSREASVDGVPVHVSRLESALLEELLRAEGRVVIKDLLVDRLYSFDEPVTDNALEALVSRLRKKLTGSGAGVRIETIRGIGYRLAVDAQDHGA